MKITIAEFSDLNKALKSFQALCGTKADYIEAFPDLERKCLELRTGYDELSARYRVPNILVEDYDPQFPRFALSLSRLVGLIAGKKGTGLIDVNRKTMYFQVGKFKADAAVEPLRVLKQRSTDSDAPARGSKSKSDNESSWFYFFPTLDKLSDPVRLKSFSTAFSAISLDDQTRGVFSKGSYFGARIEPDKIQLVGYDTLHIGHMQAECTNEVPVNEDGAAELDIVITKALAQKLAKGLSDDITIRIGKEGSDWLVAYDERCAVCLRTFDVRFNVAKVLKQVAKETTPLFKINEIEDIATFSKRAESRSVATLSTRSGDVVFEIKGEKSTVTEPMEAEVLNKGEEIKMSAGALADCVQGLKGVYEFAASEKFLRMSNDQYQFLVIRGVAS